MKLSVIIVSYKVRFYLEQCLVSVLRAVDSIDSEVFVVDNHSDDGTVEYLKERFADRVTIIESRHNLGFARANNIAIRQSCGQYVLLLNPDTFVSEESLAQVLTFMDAHPEAGGAGAQMFNADGTLARESRRALPTPWVSLLKMLGSTDRYYMSRLPWDQPGQIEVMSGAFCMLRREALDRVGLLDEDFFMYGEDIDLSYRIVKGGYQNWYVPARIVHYKGESTQKSSYRYVHVFYQAMLIFFRKHYGHLSLLVTLPIKLAIYGRAFLALIRMQYDRLRQSLGFTREGRADMQYLFVGGQPMLDECRELARRRALTATFQSAAAPVVTQPGLCVVYDLESFSFSQVISMAAEHQNAVIGTYNPQTRILITPMEIIQ